MIDWSKLEWDASELNGIKEIKLNFRIKDELIAVQTTWVDEAGKEVRHDSHIHVLKLPESTGEIGKVA